MAGGGVWAGGGSARGRAAPAGPHRGRGSSQDDGFLKRVEDPVRHIVELTAFRDVLEQHHELVATEARHDVVGAYRVAQPCRCRLQEFVAGVVVEGIDHDLVRTIATRERKEATTSKTHGNVFGLMPKIGPANAVLAADYAALLAQRAGKVVFLS